MQDSFSGPQEEGKLKPQRLARESLELDPTMTSLSNQWFACAFMLKKSPTRRTITSFGPNLDAAVRFLDSLGPLAERSGLEDAGAMMRVIMPQKDTVSKNQGGKKGEDREVIAAALKAMGLPDAEVEETLTTATMLRSLLRMKIADKNDIGTARGALTELQSFFTALTEHATSTGQADWDVFQQLLHA